jgi:hypothetical protein
MTPLARSAETASPVCAYHDDLMELLRDVRRDQRDTLDRVNQLGTDLATHIAIHTDRERGEARGVQWARIAENILTWGTITVAALLCLYALLHATDVLRLFGAG